MVRLSGIAGLVILLSCGPDLTAESRQDDPLRIYIRAGKKTHGPGEHDHPRFLAEWKELLKARGATVEGSLDFPSEADLSKTDVLIFYAADGASIAADQRARLDAYLKRGGGIVVLHDAVCGNDPQWFKTVAGGAWEHGRSKFHHGVVGLYFQDREHPITRGFGNFFLDDEIYWDLHLMPEAKVLGVGFRTEKEITPQLWVYEKDNYRAFVSLQGHKHASFSLPHYRALLLRGIAWAGKREADSLVTKEELATLRYPEGGPFRPDRAHEPLALHPDFDLQLLGAEPEVVKPISLDWDAKGRLWVAMTPGYPQKARTWGAPPADRLVIFDGPKRTVFYDRLDLVTSLVVYKDGAIVTQAPDILFVRDTDGDDRADKVETLFTGFGFGDTHAVTSNLRWGLDGWIYGTQGYSGGGSRNVMNAKGDNFGHIGNGIFRFKPDGSAIEMVCSYGSNTWGLDFAADGEIFFTMANESHLRHVVLGDAALARAKAGNLQGWKQIVDHRDSRPLLRYDLVPYKQIDCVGGFTAAAGSALYDGGAWPGDWQGSHFVTECTVNLVHQDVIRPEGATYVASRSSRAEEFVASRDIWFRPVDVQFGPDGALYVADFYNQAVVHNDTRGPRHGPYNAAVRPDRDRLHGRLWKIQHKAAAKLDRPELATLPAAELVRVLEHPNGWHRATAHRLLLEKQDASVAPALEAILKGSNSAARVRALWLLHLLKKAPANLASLAADPDTAVRKNAVRILGLVQQGEKALREALKDSDARVRIEALNALAAFPPTAETAAAVADLYPALADDWSRSAALGVAIQEPGLFVGPAGLTEDLASAVGVKQNPALAAQVVIQLAEKGEPAVKQAALARLFKTLKPEIVPAATPELRKALQALLASGDPRVVGAALPFASRWDREGSLGRALEPMAVNLLATIRDVSQADEVRLQNLATVLAIPAVRGRAIEAAAELLGAASTAGFQGGVIEALGHTTDLAAADALVAAYARLAPGAREGAFTQLAKRPEWAARLVQAIEEGKLAPGLLGVTGVFRLRNHPDRDVARRAAKAIDAVQGAETKSKDQIIAALLPVVAQPGNREKGKALFAENCLKCHTYKGEGKNVAPDLTGMGAHGAADLLTHIVDPNRAVEPNYIAFNVRTKGGEVFNGIVVRETKESVVLRSNEGDREIRRADIDVMVSTGLSLMPTGLESLGGEALRDMLGFLTADAGNFRLLDLQTAASASSKRGLYDPRREPNNFRPRKYGMHTIEAVPFLVLDPDKSVTGNNAIVLKGGHAKDWHCKTKAPQRVTVNVGFAFEKLHVLGGIAAWGTLDPNKAREPVCKLTYHFADGREETKVLYDGVEFSDWIRRVDVPGSKHVDGFLERGAPGQLRYFAVEPKRKGVAIHHLSLESYDNQMAPTFIALTAEIAGDGHSAAPAAPASRILIVGGGSSHDYDKWWKGKDAETLGASYTSAPGEILPALGKLDVLYLGNNQPLSDPELRKAIFDFVDAGKGLLLVHASTWYNWKDWPDYNRKLVGGGSRGHEALQEFEVLAVDKDHPVMAGVPASFTVRDELYQFVKDPQGSEIHILAKGKSLKTGKEYPVAWIAAHPKGRIVCITLGHDGAAHEHDAFKALLRNAAAWAGRQK